MTAPPDLPAFLLARADDRERQAPDIHEAYCNAVTQVEWGSRVYDATDCDCGEPARVLAECAALRAGVELHRHEPKGPGPELYDGSRNPNEGVFGCVICSCVPDDPGWHLTGGWCDTLRLLGGIWPGHPDFDPSWRV